MNIYCKLLLVSLLVSLNPTVAGEAKAVKKDDIDRGRYLIVIAGCNDCHTPGYMEAAGNVPESQWLTGDSFGWRGPWGTTYAANLRNSLQKFTEDQWVLYAKNLNVRPPMPWFNVRQMKDKDLRMIYRYIRHLGPAGKAAPAYVPPDKEPAPPYATFPAPPPE